MEALPGVLFLTVKVVGGIRSNVVPGVVGVDVVGGFEVALAELERGGAFAVRGWRVGAVGWDDGGGW